MNLRCFIAIGVPEPIKTDIGEVIDILKKHDADIKWVRPENMHLTLKFLGGTDEALLPKIKESLSDIVSSYAPFYIRIYGTGVFPNKRYPRVIWIGIEDPDILKKLKEDIEDSMSIFGYQREDKEFNPHLTLGRVRSQKGVVQAVTELDNFKGKEFGSFSVERIELMKSELKPGGPEYGCLYEIPFMQR
jgi:RNA 2',3'-cyclic 3'-phosphodiesterase